MSRKKKPIFIPDLPITTVSIITNNNQPAAEENNGNTNNNNYNSNGGDMKPEPISAAFVSNQPSRLSQQQEQGQHRKQQQYQFILIV
jgi:hypothetical protein